MGVSHNGGAERELEPHESLWRRFEPHNSFLLCIEKDEILPHTKATDICVCAKCPLRLLGPLFVCWSNTLMWFEGMTDMADGC